MFKDTLAELGSVYRYWVSLCCSSLSNKGPYWDKRPVRNQWPPLVKRGDNVVNFLVVSKKPTQSVLLYCMSVPTSGFPWQPHFPLSSFSSFLSAASLPQTWGGGESGPPSTLTTICSGLCVCVWTWAWTWAACCCSCRLWLSTEMPLSLCSFSPSGVTV